ncbi:MAG: ABC transporter substrate-binding protein, partial [Paracoccus sp. (in: a-proteobacteria)]|nr:ABC transporter substrate-binding protein [Paracoccus sp. (in: a-proteobacteria)]
MTATPRKNPPEGMLTRRKLLQSGAAAGAAAAGAGVLGAPMIWAQNIRDIVLNQVGPSYSVIADICERASADLGFRIVGQTADTTSLMARVVNQPETIDIADFEFFGMQRVYRSGNLQPIEIARISLWDRMTPLMRDGLGFEGEELSRQGTVPFKVLYTDSPDSTEFAPGKTDWATLMPSIYNADTLGLRPDLVGHEITSWAELFNPDFRGRTALVNIPQIGIMDVAMALEARGDLTYGDKGNMTTGEIDKTIETLMQLKRDGQF